jgi:serine/threonine protein kinase
MVGSPAFMAPEVVNSNIDPPAPVTKAVDIWALGITLYCLLFGRVPFMSDSQAGIYRAICDDDWEPMETMGSDQIPTGGRYPADEESDGGIVMHLLEHCLEKDPKLRITLDEMKVRKASFASQLLSAVVPTCC